MATGTLKNESWTEINPVTAISGDSNNGSKLHWFLNGKTLRVTGYVTFSGADTASIAIDSKYRMVSEDFCFLSYSAWSAENQVWKSGAINGTSGVISFDNRSGGLFGRLVHDIMLL